MIQHQYTDSEGRNLWIRGTEMLFEDDGDFKPYALRRNGFIPLMAKRCIHGSWFPCSQCTANRRWNEAATKEAMTDADFEARYTTRTAAPAKEGA